MRRFIIYVVLTLSLAGCLQTATQRQYSQLTSSTKQLNNKYHLCVFTIQTLPEYQLIKSKLPFDFTQATIEQLTDRNKATKEEVAAISAAFSHQQGCRKEYSSGLLAVSPEYVPTMTSFWEDLDAIHIKLVKNEISWGEANTSAKQLQNTFTKQLVDIEQQIVRKFHQANQAELLEAEAARQRWDIQQQANEQRNSENLNRLLNNLSHNQTPNQNQIKQTNCYALGNSIQCTSY